MSHEPLRELIARLRRTGDEAGGPSDARLLERYVQARDDAAFELLVWRHGALVLATARRCLGHTADVEDAFQATFLTLARKANSIRRSEALAAWLHQVVLRIARRLRQQRQRRKLHECALTAQDIGHEGAPPDDLGPVLDAEIDRLPDHYRRPVVLCYVQGLAVTEAARELGCPRGTVLSRLASARALLQRRLLRRGIAPAALSLLTAKESAATPPNLIAAAARLATDPATAPPSLVSLSNGVLRAMFWKKCQTAIVIAAVLAFGGVMVGTGRADKPMPGNEPPAPKQLPANVERAQREDLQRELEKRRHEIDTIEARASAGRVEIRQEIIELEEQLKAEEYRQEWQRERQRIALQNLETTLREHRAHLRQTEMDLRNIEAELIHAQKLTRVWEQAPADQAKTRMQVELLTHNRQTRMEAIQTLTKDIQKIERELEEQSNSLAKGEEKRMKVRIQLRQQLAKLEEKARSHDRAAERQIEHLQAETAALIARLHRVDQK